MFHFFSREKEILLKNMITCQTSAGLNAGTMCLLTSNSPATCCTLIACTADQKCLSSYPSICRENLNYVCAKRRSASGDTSLPSASGYQSTFYTIPFLCWKIHFQFQLMNIRNSIFSEDIEYYYLRFKEFLLMFTCSLCLNLN